VAAARHHDQLGRDHTARLRRPLESARDRVLVYLRADAKLARELESRGGEAFSYDTKRRTVRVASYWSVPEAELDDEDSLVGWSRRALAAARAAKK
jgi:TfoX/Sxy family transcriptional regulator of competence genes